MTLEPLSQIQRGVTAANAKNKRHRQFYRALFADSNGKELCVKRQDFHTKLNCKVCQLYWFDDSGRKSFACRREAMCW